MPLCIELTPDEALRRFNAQQFSPCYLVYGEEPFFVDQVLRGLIEKGVEKEWRDWNCDRLDGRQASPEEVVTLAKRSLMGGVRRVVIVQNADQINDPKGRLAAYAAAPSSNTVMVFVMQKSDKRDKRAALFEALKGHATRVSCRPLYDREVIRFIRQEANRQALDLTEETIEFLKESLGRDPYLIRHELEKTALMDTERKDGEQPLAPPRAYSIFEFIAAVEARDMEKGLRLLSALLVDGAPPLMILAMLARHFRMMAAAKEKAAPALEGQGKIPASRASASSQAPRLWSSREIRSAFDLFHNADNQLKGGGGGGGGRAAASIILEQLLIDLCRPPAGGDHFCRAKRTVACGRPTSVAEQGYVEETAGEEI